MILTVVAARRAASRGERYKLVRQWELQVAADLLIAR